MLKTVFPPEVAFSYLYTVLELLCCYWTWFNFFINCLEAEKIKQVKPKPQVKGNIKVKLIRYWHAFNITLPFIPVLYCIWTSEISLLRKWKKLLTANQFSIFTVSSHCFAIVFKYFGHVNWGVDSQWISLELFLLPGDRDANPRYDKMYDKGETERDWMTDAAVVIQVEHEDNGSRVWTDQENYLDPSLFPLFYIPI